MTLIIGDFGRLPPQLGYVWDVNLLDWVPETQPGGGGGGGGDASAANQVIGNASLASIDTKLTSPLTVTGALTDAQLRATAVPISGSVAANAGTNLNTSALALDATLTGRTQKAQITDGTRDGTVKAASSLPVATDTAVVVTARDAVKLGDGTTSPVAVKVANASTLPTDIALTVAQVPNFLSSVPIGGATILQNSGNDGNGTSLDVSLMSFVLVETILANPDGSHGLVNFEVSTDNISWSAVTGTNVMAPSSASAVAFFNGLWIVPVIGNIGFRARLSLTSGQNIKVIAFAPPPTLLSDGSRGPVAVKAASTAAVGADKALVVAVSPNNAVAVTNANLDAALSTLATASAQSTGNTSLGTIKTNTDSLVTAGGGGYVRQDSTATIAKESGGNLATIVTSLATLDTDLKATQPRSITNFPATQAVTQTTVPWAVDDAPYSVAARQQRIQQLLIEAAMPTAGFVPMEVLPF